MKLDDIDLCDVQDCTGCMACRQKCSQGAISEVLRNGFLYPIIDRDKCIKCGACVVSCPVLNVKKKTGNLHENEKICLAAYNRDDNIRMKSSSGGTFSVMAEKVLANGGIVFGAAWDKEMNLRHKYIENFVELDSLRRSKYVQSNTLDTFKEAFSFLKKGRQVLYCGTPCQIAGLTAFLGYKEYDNLIKVDVICQGVPSNEIFKKYISEIEKKYGVEVLDANFRSKDRGWRCGLLLLLLVRKGKRKYWLKRVLDRNEYYNAFIKEYFMRESCYDCQFKCSHQGYYSDVSIADFWRIGKSLPLKVENYEKGISAVIINTEKGKTFFESCNASLIVIERAWNEFMTNGGMYSCRKKENNEEALQFLLTHSWKETQAKFFPVGLKERLKNGLYLVLGERWLRVIFKITGKIK